MLLIFVLLRKDLIGPLAVLNTDNDDLVERKRMTFFHRLRSIDFGGQILFLLGFGLLVLSFTWAGVVYQWNSPAVVVSLCAGIVLSLSFLGWEYLLAPGNPLNLIWPHQKAMISWNLINNRDISLLFYINFATGASMYAVRLLLFT
jgi:hypothetical protein